jgi:hypothetical protein
MHSAFNHQQELPAGGFFLVPELYLSEHDGVFCGKCRLKFANKELYLAHQSFSVECDRSFYEITVERPLSGGQFLNGKLSIIL